MLDSGDISRALSRISHEILERNKGAEILVLLGIPWALAVVRLLDSKADPT